MDHATPTFEAAVWAAVEGRASDEQRTLLEAAPEQYRRVVERLIDDTDERLEGARQLRGAERALVVADFESDLALLESTYDLMTRTEASAAAGLVAEPPGEVRLQASWSNGAVVLWAGGPGVPPEARERIFEPFYRVGGHSEESGGVGLGLALVAQIAAAHGGSARCEAREGGGSRFVVDFAGVT